MQDFQESESIDLMLVMMMMMTTDFRLVTRIESQAIVSVTVCVRHWAVSASVSLSLWQWLLTPVGRRFAQLEFGIANIFKFFKSIFVSESWRPQVQVSVLLGYLLSGRFTPSYFKLIV